MKKKRVENIYGIERGGTRAPRTSRVGIPFEAIYIYIYMHVNVRPEIR